MPPGVLLYQIELTGCIWGELRAVRITASPLRKMLLEPLKADMLILAQRHFADDECRLALLSSTPVVHAELYAALMKPNRMPAAEEKPEAERFFGAEHYDARHFKKHIFFNPYFWLEVFFFFFFFFFLSPASEENMSKVRGNWLNAGNSQVLINHKMLEECMLHRSLFDKYDLFVLGTQSTFETSMSTLTASAGSQGPIFCILFLFQLPMTFCRALGLEMS